MNPLIATLALALVPPATDMPCPWPVCPSSPFRWVCDAWSRRLAANVREGMTEAEVNRILGRDRPRLGVLHCLPDRTVQVWTFYDLTGEMYLEVRFKEVWLKAEGRNELRVESVGPGERAPPERPDSSRRR